MNANETESFMEYTRNKKKRKQNEKTENSKVIRDVLDYLGLDGENPNIGTRNKQVIMTKVLYCLQKWKTGQYYNWIRRLSLRLNLSVRTTRENYIDPLIAEGIIREDKGELTFVGIPKDRDDYK